VLSGTGEKEDRRLESLSTVSTLISSLPATHCTGLWAQFLVVFITRRYKSSVEKSLTTRILRELTTEGFILRFSLMLHFAARVNCRDEFIYSGHSSVRDTVRQIDPSE
jgi:hypothetical protein